MAFTLAESKIIASTSYLPQIHLGWVRLVDHWKLFSTVSSIRL